VRCALEALASEPLHVVATLPSGDPASFDAPTNATVCSFVPHGPILERAACAITHGGMGATQKALARGVPVCVVPFGRDQLEVARRVEVAGAGTRLPAPRLSPKRLRAAVKDAARRQEGARRVARGVPHGRGSCRGRGRPRGADRLIVGAPSGLLRSGGAGAIASTRHWRLTRRPDMGARQRAELPPLSACRLPETAGELLDDPLAERVGHHEDVGVDLVVVPDIGFVLAAEPVDGFAHCVVEMALHHPARRLP
jgi:hypothetical protein